MKLSMQMTADGIVRALRLKAHTLAEDAAERRRLRSLRDDLRGDRDEQSVRKAAWEAMDDIPRI